MALLGFPPNSIIIVVSSDGWRSWFHGWKDGSLSFSHRSADLPLPTLCCGVSFAKVLSNLFIVYFLERN